MWLKFYYMKDVERCGGSMDESGWLEHASVFRIVIRLLCRDIQVQSWNRVLADLLNCCSYIYLRIYHP